MCLLLSLPLGIDLLKQNQFPPRFPEPEQRRLSFDLFCLVIATWAAARRTYGAFAGNATDRTTRGARAVKAADKRPSVSSGFRNDAWHRTRCPAPHFWPDLEGKRKDWRAAIVSWMFCRQHFSLGFIGSWSGGGLGEFHGSGAASWEVHVIWNAECSVCGSVPLWVVM